MQNETYQIANKRPYKEQKKAASDCKDMSPPGN